MDVTSPIDPEVEEDAMTQRTRHGVTFYDESKAYRGYTLFAPMGSPTQRNVWLIDMEGRIVHRWQMADWVSMHAVLLPNGNLLYGGKLRKGPLGDLAGAGGIVQEADWEGDVVWEFEEPNLHHDWLRLRNGNTMVTKYTEVPQEIASRVKGGIPGTEWQAEEFGGKGIMWGDTYQEISPEGKVVWDWKDFEHLDPEKHRIPEILPRKCWTTNNSFYEMPDGNLIVSMVWLSTIAIIDKVTGTIVWEYGPATDVWWRNPISFQHNTTLLPNGNILLFDNGRHRIFPPYYHPPDFSRVIEINPKTSEVEWEYKDKNPQDFFSPFMAGCERMPNNNTLICEAAHGRIFEVTYDKELAWEYVSPFYMQHPSPNFGLTNMFFRAHRYGPDYPGLQGKILEPTRYETWNRLYAPEAYSRLAPRKWTGTGATAPAEQRQSPSEVSSASRELSGPDEDLKVKQRLESLGY